MFAYVRHIFPGEKLSEMDDMDFAMRANEASWIIETVYRQQQLSLAGGKG